jgi:superfamily II DNA or RNA helicase
VTTRAEIGDMIDRLTIPNPVYANNEKLGFSNRGVSATLRLYEENEFGELLIPRNAPVWYGIPCEDERVEGHPVKFNSKIQLREDQIPAVEKIMSTDDGILQAGTGKGKTIMSIEIMARYGKTTLILVHKEFLMDQFSGHIKNLLGLSDDEIGYARGNPKTWKWKDRKVVIGMLQSVYAHIEDLPEGFVNHFGLVISDECHRVSASTWARVIAIFPCKKRLGLTATPKRSDGLEVVFHFHLGPIQYQLMGVNMKPKVVTVTTEITDKDIGVNTNSRSNAIMAKLISALAENRERNVKILQLLVQASKSGRKIILLSDRRAHVEYLKNSFDLNKERHGLQDIQTRYYLGGMDKENRREAEQNGDILFATFQMAKEGLDIPELDTLFLGTPNSSEITIEQSLGRIARSAEGKKTPMVIDILDGKIGICHALYNKRMRVYNKMELEVN